jgi:hypothetical protein
MKMMWKEAVMSYFKALFQHLPEGTEENYGKVKIAGLCVKKHKC